MRADFPSVPGAIHDTYCAIADGRLEATFPRGQIGARGSGCSFFSRFTRSLNEATLEYDVFFPSGFQWTRGGKLPGLCGGCTLGPGV